MCHHSLGLVAERFRGQGKVAVSSNNKCEIGHSSAPFVCDYIDFLGQRLSAPSQSQIACSVSESMMWRKAAALVSDLALSVRFVGLYRTILCVFLFTTMVWKRGTVNHLVMVTGLI